jgi:hypothetical protein
MKDKASIIELQTSKNNQTTNFKNVGFIAHSLSFGVWCLNFSPKEANCE